MLTALLLPPELLGSAREVGGELNPDFDRQTSTSERLPFYSVVGRNSKDSSYRGTMNGKTVEVSRAGSFRRKNEEGVCDYYEELPELAIVDARTCYTIFEDNKVVCRGISTKGLGNAVWTESDGRVIVGASCDKSPYCRWVWEKDGGKEGRCITGDGKVITKEDLANCTLQLWCLDLTKDEWCIVQFSSGAIKVYREAARSVEMQEVKMHSLAWKLTTEPIDNGPSAAPSYVPKLEAVRVLTEDEFNKVNEKRCELVVKAAALAPPSAKTGELMPPKPALPSAFKDVPITDPNDPFAAVD